MTMYHAKTTTTITAKIEPTIMGTVSSSGSKAGVEFILMAEVIFLSGCQIRLTSDKRMFSCSIAFSFNIHNAITKRDLGELDEFSFVVFTFGAKEHWFGHFHQTSLLLVLATFVVVDSFAPLPDPTSQIQS